MWLKDNHLGKDSDHTVHEKNSLKKTRIKFVTNRQSLLKSPIINNSLQYNSFILHAFFFLESCDRFKKDAHDFYKGIFTVFCCLGILILES